MMYTVVAYGVKDKEAWERELGAFPTSKAAEKQIRDYVQWHTQFANFDWPESCQGYDIDDDDERGWEMIHESRNEFLYQLLLAHNVPKEHHDWIEEHMHDSPDELPKYRIDQRNMSKNC